MGSSFKPISPDWNSSTLAECLETLRGKRILFLGNVDNIGIRYFFWAKRHGLDATLVRTDEGGRGDIKIYGITPDHPYFSSTERWEPTEDDFIHPEKIATRAREIEKKYDYVFVCGWHGLMLSADIALPKLFTPSGYEVYVDCSLKHYMMEIWKRRSFFFLGKWWIALRHPHLVIQRIAKHLSYYRVSVRALSQMTLINDLFEGNFEFYRKYNPRVVTYSLGENLGWIQTLKNQDLLRRLTEETRTAPHVFLWLSRLLFQDPFLTKGPERFADALDAYADQIEQGKIIVFIGAHGDDAQAFQKLCSDKPYYRYIRWVSHLHYPDLLAYLSIPNAVLFAEFGGHNHCLSGIGRDAMLLGTPLVSSMSREEFKARFGVDSPHLWAESTKEISRVIHDILEMNQEELTQIRLQHASIGKNFLEFDSLMPPLVRELIS